MKLLNAKNLRAQAISFEKKEFRRQVRRTIRRINHAVRNCAKSGKFKYEYSMSEYFNHYYATWVAFRWLRLKSKGLNVRVIEDKVVVTKSGKKYVERISVSISW